MMCTFAIFEIDGIKKYSCKEVKKLHNDWKLDFRKKNLTDLVEKSGRIDRSYDHFCRDIDSFLSQCKCDHIIDNECHKCKKEDQDENGFCRCESRNIAHAKHLRKIWENPWQKDKKAEDMNIDSYHRERSKREDTCKHEWGSENLSDSDNPFFTCNKCDAVL